MDEYLKIIIKTSIKTIIAFLLVMVFSLTIIFNVSPSIAIDFYSKLGFENRVYHYTCVLASRGELKYKYASASMSIELNRPKSEKEKRIADFLNSANEQTLQNIDQANLNATISKAYHVVLYSIENYFAIEHFECNSSLVWNGNEFVAIDQIVLPDNAKDCAIVINQLLKSNYAFQDEDLEKLLGFATNGLEKLFVLRTACALADKLNYSTASQIRQTYDDAMSEYLAS